MRYSILIAIILATSILIPNVGASRISDYIYDDENETDIIVANRSADKMIALTFDDGPHPKYTKEILEILKENKAKATFFVIGKNAQAYPEIIKQIYSNGHEIGNHTYSHPQLKTISVDQFISEIQMTQNIVKEITGQTPTLFRPPGGYLNNEFVDVTEKLDCTSVLWSWRQDTRDWACPSSKTIIKTVLENINSGDIILFHDYNSKVSPTPNALRIILPELKNKGYSFVTVTELMNNGEINDR